MSVSASGCRSVSLQTGRETTGQSEQQTGVHPPSSSEEMSRLVQAGGNQLRPPSPHPFSALQQRNMHRSVMKVFGAIDRKTD